MKTKAFKLVFPISLLLFALSISTAVSSGRLFSDPSCKNLDGVEMGFGPGYCYEAGIIFVGKSIVAGECFCDLTFSHFVVFCDDRYYDSCRLIMCSGGLCCHVTYP
jgi:hypothetical protein